MSMWNALGLPSTRIPNDSTVFVSHVLPPVVCYFALAALAVTPQTHAVRVALRPLIVLLTLRAVLSVDMSRGEPEYSFLNTTLVLLMVSGTVRSLGWTLEKEPLVRHLRPRKSSPSIIMDALDLASSYRGHGWEWSRGLYIPRETRPVNRLAFAFYAFLSAVVHTGTCGVFHRAALSLLPVGAGSIPGGSTLFDESLPLLVRYLRASLISIFIGIALYASMQIMYDLCTIFGILLGQDPAQWPPAFDSPWFATSLNDLWGRRWHQFLRQMFLLLGGYPLSFVLGRAGTVIGAFLASALWHQIYLLSLGGHPEFRWMLVGFGMMAPGVLAERAFRRLTGRRVGGVVGWVWTMAWLLVWGTVISEGFARAPMDRSTLVDAIPPVRIWIERLMMGFDDWLHTN
ncbi:hypothetical protein L210DRAFT_3536283 [Boletus edulis BED1]|uniref:Wax synthase domain-containing protein n=1 Tax=Boletus edulis BED1 TaxID=1328754 RepID=A0AAD4BYA4_BOLED|nr:hypothetical protein L210DRAFT_3536283 [Boletus edulis BED1]